MASSPNKREQEDGDQQIDPAPAAWRLALVDAPIFALGQIDESWADR
jgi:hypothetical protein